VKIFMFYVFTYSPSPLLLLWRSQGELFSL
jgi:hypothetical protein